MAFNLFGVRSRPTGANASIELREDDGATWSIETNASANSLIIKRGNTTSFTLKPNPDANDIALDLRVSVSAPNNELGVAAYFDTTITGTTAGHTYGLGSWINTSAATTLAAGHIIVPFEGGVYAGESQSTARIVFAGQHQAVLTDSPASLYAWRLNTSHTVDAIMTAANPGSVGYAADATTDSTKIGDIPFVEIGSTTYYIRLYDAAS